MDSFKLSGCRAVSITAAVLAAVFTLPASARAEVTLASPFSHHMVLQQGLHAPLWGWAEPGERVTVTFAGQTHAVTAAADRKWRVDLDPLPASSESRALTIQGSNTATPVALDDVVVGEVWIASGQSNMGFTLSKSRSSWAGVEDEETEIAAADYPHIRMFTAEPVRTNSPQATVPGEWLVCSPSTVPGFSAVGYYFARDLHRELKVPIGILTLSYGASTPQAWIRREAIAAEPSLKAELDRYDATVEQYVPPSEEELAAWRAASEKAKAANQRMPREPKPHPSQNQHNPTVLFNGVIEPMVPYCVRGVIWYQGESITGPRALFPRWNEILINDWRKLWGRELPFYFCQLAAYEKHSPDVRELQAETLKLPKTGMAVTIDIGDRKNVHPKNKQGVGERLARLALARDYGHDIESVGPTATSAAVEGVAIRVRFAHAKGGLTTRNGPLRTFEVAAADGKYLPAEATIDGDAVVVRSDKLAAPVSARYAWANYPDGANLYNQSGLPAAPFRTDHLTP